jgi:uncharacterized membrane protein
VIIIAIAMLTDMVITGVFGERGPSGFVGGLVSLAISTLVDLGVVATLLKVYDNVESADFKDLWHPSGYLPYLGATVLMGVIVFIGFVLLIVPGLIAMTVLMFTKFVVVDRKLGPIEALKESARITKGNRMTLFLFLLSLIVINLIGLLALLVGLLVTIPVSGLAMLYAYRTLGHKASEVVPAAAPAPTPAA